MPGGGTPLGFAYFAAAKFIGYTAFCRWVIEPRAVSSPFSITDAIASVQPPSAFKAGAARTAIGILAGTVSGLLLFYGFLDHLGNSAMPVVIFFALLIPIRVIEWRLLLWWMYRDFPFTRRARGILVTLGILASFTLDAIGIAAAFVVPGGAWIC